PLAPPRPELVDALDQGMADIGTFRPAETPVRGRLERQQGQNVVDIGPHTGRALWPPGPDRGRYIVDNRYGRRSVAHKLRDAMREIGTVDDHQNVRRIGENRRRGFADAPPEKPQAPQHI